MDKALNELTQILVKYHGKHIWSVPQLYYCFMLLDSPDGFKAIAESKGLQRCITRYIDMVNDEGDFMDLLSDELKTKYLNLVTLWNENGRDKNILNANDLY